MDLFTRTGLRELLAPRGGPCISIFMPTRRGGAEADPIRFRNLLGRAGELLVADGTGPDEVKGLLAPLYALLEDDAFWRNQGDGLAVFRADGFLRVYRLPWTFPEEVEVGGLFLVTPLLPLLNGDGRYYVLALSQNSVRLFQGTRFTLNPVELKGVPRSLEEAMRRHDRDEVLTFHTRPTSGGSWGAIFQGHGVGIDDAKDDLLRYFRQIDRGLRAALREEHAPLLVASVGYLQPLYRQASRYSHLLPVGVEGCPDRLSEKQLHERAWAAVEPHFRRALGRVVELFRQAAGTGRTACDPIEVIPAACRGEVGTLLIAQGKRRWGTLVAGPDEVALHERQEHGDVDLLDFAAIQTLRHGHEVYALPPEDMPAAADMAAIYHLPLPRRGRRP